MTKKKQAVILQILPRIESGGVERGTLEIAKAITESGFKSIVVSSGGIYETLLTKTGTLHIKLPVHTKNPVSIYLNSKRLKKIIEEYNVDIVHARSRAPAWSAYLACKNSKAKFITTFHGVYSITSSLKRKYNSVMTKGEKIIAVSEFIKDHIQTNYQIASKKIKTIHRGVDLEYFSPEKIQTTKLQHYFQNWHIPEDKHIILFPARFTDWKGHKTLIEALSLIKEKNFYCLMVGSDQGHENYVKSLTKQITELNLSANISFHEHATDIINIYGLADIIVSASTRPEAFGRTIVEAGALGKIIIATNHGGARETIIDGKTGFLVEQKDPKQLAEILEKILKFSKKKRSEISNKAQNHVRENFSIKKMQKETISLYKKILK
jgi:glycosyltransferase involved in cell wall biosynthesis